MFKGEKQTTRKRGRAVLSDSDSEDESGAKKKVIGSVREENESEPSAHTEVTGEGMPEEGEDGATAAAGAAVAAAAVVPDVSDDSDDGIDNNIDRGYVLMKIDVSNSATC